MAENNVYESIVQGLKEAIEDSEAEKPFLKRNTIKGESINDDKTEK